MKVIPIKIPISEEEIKISDDGTLLIYKGSKLSEYLDALITKEGKLRVILLSKKQAKAAYLETRYEIKSNYNSIIYVNNKYADIIAKIFIKPIMFANDYNINYINSAILFRILCDALNNCNKDSTILEVLLIFKKQIDLTLNRYKLTGSDNCIITILGSINKAIEEKIEYNTVFFKSITDKYNPSYFIKYNIVKTYNNNLISIEILAYNGLYTTKKFKSNKLTKKFIEPVFDDENIKLIKKILI